ncbi:MAG: hypothetical protein HDQ88_01325 [Clostridia bacterium]|nr:hypothetical protein [Clostridia bacterium]
MSQFIDIIQNEDPTLSQEELLDEDYQTNMYLLDSALKAVQPASITPGFTKSAYDNAILRLIDAVHLE